MGHERGAAARGSGRRPKFAQAFRIAARVARPPSRPLYVRRRVRSSGNDYQSSKCIYLGRLQTRKTGDNIGFLVETVDNEEHDRP